MKNLLLAFVLCFPILSFSQNNAFYESHEVDSVAIPRGGYGYLTIFINANLQIPYMAKVAKVNGYVSLSGVVDEQGKISQIEVIKGIRPDCDREAIRIFGLFNAWQAALKGGKGVRQKVFVRVPFKSTENITFVDGEQFTFLSENFTPMNGDEAYVYILAETIDTLKGLPVGDKSVFKGKKNIATFIYKKDSVENYTPAYPESIKDSTLKIYATRNEDAQGNMVGELISYLLDGTMIERALAANGKPSLPYVKYYKNGMIREYAKYADNDKNISEMTTWHPNGQISEIIRYKDSIIAPPKKNKMAQVSPKHLKYLLNQWSENGEQNVKNGSGRAIFKMYDIEKGYKVFTETGSFKNYKQDGIWKGYLEQEDGFSFKEFYESGILTNGIAYYSKGDSSVYSGEVEISPEFKGGSRGYAEFLQGNLKYPRDAQKENAEGKAYLQFVVCTDGTLCDFKVLKSAGHSSLDKEALRVIQKSSGLWTPGIIRGRKARAKYTIPISFKLQ